MYSISSSCMQHIISHMNSTYPYEGCGIIVSRQENQNELSYFYPINNNHIYPNHHFSFNQQDWIDTIYSVQLKCEVISCYVHSHVEGDGQLSEEDLSGIYDFSAIQAIVHYTKKNSPSLYFYRFNATTKTYDQLSVNVYLDTHTSH